MIYLITILLCIVLLVSGLCLFLLTNKKEEYVITKEEEENAIDIFLKNISFIKNITKKNKKNIDVPVLYINLPKHKERNNFMKNQLKKYTKSFQRVSGVNGSKIVEKNPEIKHELKYVTDGEVGCALAHMKAVSKAYDIGSEWTLILEDDADLSLSPLWPMTLSELTKNAPEDATVIQLCSLYKSPTKITPEYLLKNTKNMGLLKTPYDSWGAQAYLISRKGAKKLIELSDNATTLTSKFKLSTPSGKGTSENLLYHNLYSKSYTLWPSWIFPNNNSKSMISTVGHIHSDKLFLLCSIWIIQNFLISIDQMQLIVN